MAWCVGIGYGNASLVAVSRALQPTDEEGLYTASSSWFPRSCATEMAPTTGNSMYRPYYAVEFSQILPATWKQAIIHVDKSAGGFASETLRHVGYGVGFVQIGAPSKPAGTVRPMTIAVGST